MKPGQSGPIFAQTLVCAALLSLVSCKEESGISFGNDRIDITHVVDLSDADLKNLTAILEKHDKSLYQIRLFEKGKVKSTAGTLSFCLSQAVLDEMTSEAAAKGSSDAAGQISAAVETRSKDSSPNVTPEPTAPSVGQSCNISVALKSEADELMRQVRPILEKYSKR